MVDLRISEKSYSRDFFQVFLRQLREMFYRMKSISD